jgi:hypothetical protein
MTVLSLAGLSVPAAAHVKWFCPYTIDAQPQHLASVVNGDFEELVLVAIGALLFGTIVDETFVGRSLNRSLRRLRSTIPMQGEVLVRACCAFQLISLWAYGGIILTPELKTDIGWVSWLQLAMAACLLARRTVVLTALGIVGLYVFAAIKYGVFHMADYPIFLGIAVYLAALSLERSVLGLRPIDVLRWATAITLMWASVEKWAYPDWSYPLFANHGALGLGFSPPYYMRAAGIVEFTLAFALLATPLVRAYGAVILIAIFTAAIPTFGKIDAVGHAPIIGVLLAILLEDYAHELGRVRQVLLVPAKFFGALAAFILVYYGAHSALYGTSLL